MPKLNPVSWSKEQGFFYHPDGAYYRRQDVDEVIRRLKEELKLCLNQNGKL